MSLTPIFLPIAATYQFVNLSAAGGQSSTSRTLYSIAFNPDGSQFFTTHEDSLDIERYNPATDWDITPSPPTTDLALSTSIAGVAGLGRGIEFNGDGTKVFVGIGGAVATEYIEEHALSSAYGGTATYTTRLAAPGSAFYGFTFADSGSKIVAVSDETFYDATLSTAYDLSTAGSWSSRLDLSGTYTNLRGFCFGKTDAQVILCEIASGGGNDRLHEYSLSTPGNMGTASFVRTKNTGERITDVTFGNGGRNLYAAATDSFRQYNTVG